MIRKTIIVLFALMFCGQILQAGVLDEVKSFFGFTADVPKPPAIKLLIVHDQPGVLLEVKGKYQLYDPHTNSYLSTRFIGKRKFIQALKDGLKWGEEFPGLHQLKILPDSDKVTTLVDGVEYKGNIYIYDIGGTISVVNEVPVEDYLKSILSPQFENKLPEELYAAIAIVARTHAYAALQNSKTAFWDVEASKIGYEGNAVTARENGILKGIETTRYMTMLKDGVPFFAEWGSKMGGAGKEGKPVFSKITLFEAEEMAKNGMHAAQILSKAFPGEIIELEYHE